MHVLDVDIIDICILETGVRSWSDLWAFVCFGENEISGASIICTT